MAELNTHVTASGVRYLATGDDQFGLLVFTHGWRDSAEGWKYVIDELARSGATTRWRIASVQRGEVDRRNADSAGLLEDFAAQVFDVVEELAATDTPIVVVGQSMGGPVAELAAARLAHRVAGVVLVTPAPLAGWPVTAEDRTLFEAEARELDRVKAALARTGLVVGQRDTTTLRLILSTPPESERSSLQSLASWIGGHPAGNEASKVSAPVLVVVTDDPFFTEQIVREDVASRFRSAHVARVGNSGHFPHLERPEALAHLIGNFLTTLRQ